MNRTKEIIKFIETNEIDCEYKRIVFVTSNAREIDIQYISSKIEVYGIEIARNYDSFNIAVKDCFLSEVIVMTMGVVDFRISQLIKKWDITYYELPDKPITYNQLKKGVVQGKELKLLTDIIWGWDLAKLNWMLTEDEAEFIVQRYHDKIFPLYHKKIAVTGECIDSLVGYGMLVPINMTVSELIEGERSCSHFETWDSDGKLHYLSELGIHKDYRFSGLSFMKILKMIILYCRENEIEVFYTTAVSDESRAILSNKRIEKAVKLLAEKEEGRKVYKIEVNKIDVQ